MIRVAHLATVDISLRYLLLNQLRYLREQGYDVTAISAGGPLVSALTSAGIRHIAVPMTRRTLSPLADFRALVQLTAILREQGFTIVHTHTPKAGLLGQIAARRAGVPIVVNTVHGYYFTDRQAPPARWPYMLMEKVAARYSDVIFFQNEEDLAAARRLGLGLPSQWQFLGNGIDVRRFDPRTVNTAKVAALRAEFSLPPGTPTVGFVGRLVREKGLIDLLEAMRRVREASPNARLLVIGPTEPAKADAVRPDRLPAHLRDGVIFAGERDDMPEIYALMSVLALPSYREGFPRAPMEASAMAVPCVVSDIRGCRQVVATSQNGVLVPVGDIPALAAAILGFLHDPEQARSMGETGYRMARERFDERIVFGRINAEYARLLAERAPAIRRKGLPGAIQ